MSFDKLTPEAQLWLNDKLNKGELSVKEIIEKFKEIFPHLKYIHFTENKLREYAKYAVPEWKEKIEEEEEEDIESAVEKEIEHVPFQEDLFDSSEKKIDQIQKHRRVLKELWDNYQRIRFDKRQEQNKRGYLEQISRELSLLSELEEKERGLQSMMAEIREKEEQESVDDHNNFIYGYCLPVLTKKSKEVEEAKKQLLILAQKVELYIKILSELQERAKNPEEHLGDFDLIKEGEKLYTKEIYSSPASGSAQ